ncbi:MAG TPA: alkaline shock response membrane anchor protein AmaP [Clostridiaceae bacterium]|nr:alkaline shock response membrane anchor protein AmaP [Clostridiaceae bacterium]
MNNVIKRILMIIFAVFYLLTAVFTIIAAFDFQALERSYSFLNRLNRNSFFAGAVVVSVFFLLSALMFLVLGLKKDKNKKYVIRSTDNGEVRISFMAIQNLVINATYSFTELKNVDVSVSNADGGISILIKSQVLPGVSIPDLIKQVQEKVKIFIEESTGIAVNDVKVYIEDIYQENLTKNSIVSKYANK